METNNKKIPRIQSCKKIHYRGIVTIAYIYKILGAISEILLYRDLLHEWTLFARTKTSGTAGNSSKICGNEPIGKICVVSNKSHNNSLFGITRTWRVDTSRYFLFGLRERRDQIWSCSALVWHFPWIKKSCKMCFTYVHKVGIPLLFGFYFYITSFEQASCEFMYLDKWLWEQPWTSPEQMCLSSDFSSSILKDFYTL